MTARKESVQDALQHARDALFRGESREARRWAETAVRMDPDNEQTWLLLSAVASPRASVTYLNRALEINPSSERARKGMEWAIQRLRNAPAQPGVRLPSSQWDTDRQVQGDTQPTRTSLAVTQPSPIHPRYLIQVREDALVRSAPALGVWVFLFLLLAFGILAWFSAPILTAALAKAKPYSIAQVELLKSTLTYTPTFTATYTPTATPTASPTSTPTSTPTFTPTPIPTDTPLPTATPKPQVKKKKKQQVAAAPSARPSMVGAGERWIDIDLSSQRTYAMQGDQMVNSFVVSTGTWRTPTVTGVYRVYVKYRAAPMSGPGYYLPNVPYIMYFYKGYGLHGTYWHNNFGTPMSHGCVNLRTEEAGWLYNWASVGTVVNVHQ